MGGLRPGSATSNGNREVHAGKYVPYRNSLLTMVLRDSLGKSHSPLLSLDVVSYKIVFLKVLLAEWKVKRHAMQIVQMLSLNRRKYYIY